MDTANASLGWSFWRVAKYVLVTLGILFGVLVGLVAFAFWWMSSGVFTVDRFDNKTWSRLITNAEDSTCYRGGMASDIKKRLLKRGMSRADVERLLGQPDRVSNPREYQYILGMCSGFQIDYDNLHIYFDEQGGLERAAIIQH
jgi:outer membrane protein assembly factor BamE (lipoprotein component of BamABCDE complex)